MDDTDMTDVAYDIDLDVGAGAEGSAPPPQQQQQQQSPEQPPPGPVPAAYFEDLEPQRAWPESLNVQGVADFDPNDPLYWSMEHLGADPRVKQLRWVNDTSVNLDFYSAADAQTALAALTHADAAPSAFSSQTPRQAKPYSKKPDSVLTIREANAGDQKPKGAANRSNYYQRNPDIRGGRNTRDSRDSRDNRDNRDNRDDRRRRPPPSDALDYGDDDRGARRPRQRRRSNQDYDMNDDSGADRNDRRRGPRNSRPADVDSYRPGDSGYAPTYSTQPNPTRTPANPPRSNHEPRFGRLRGRSASPANEDGDGRYGFAEDTSNARARYRSRSRSATRSHTASSRRPRAPSAERWTHDRANYSERGGSIDMSMGNHRRSGGVDESRKGSSLLARMTKDGRPVNSLASRITRDGDDDDANERPRSLASRITRDGGGNEGYGRLKGDDSVSRDYGFDNDNEYESGGGGGGGRGHGSRRRDRSAEGINIRGAGKGMGGINIRGVANGA
jgi:hypothetical protein